MNYDDSPDYLKAADLHNLGSQNESFFSAPVENTADFVSKIPAFAITSIASGINSIYNSAVVAGNFFGISDAKENDLQSTLGSYDSDLGQYYAAHKQAADITGFVVTSLVPGIGGIKLFNTGQRALLGGIKSGAVGRGFVESVGLAPTLTSAGKTLTQVAGESLASSQQTFTLLNAGVLKAISGGFAQATWESLAFESMVAATMFRSPILENHDVGDIALNILTGAALGGVIGGAVNAAGVYGGIKKVITQADLESKPSTLRSSQFALQSPSDRILAAAADLQSTPVPKNTAEEALRSSRVTSINQEIRTNIHGLVDGKDAELANSIADSFVGLPPKQLVQSFQGARKIYRAGLELTPEPGHTIGYVKLSGEGVGEVSFDAISSRNLTLADKLGGRDSVLKYVESAHFTPKKNWVLASAKNLDEVEARYIWAEKLAKYEDGMTIHTSDIPLLEGALRNKLSEVNVTDGVHSYKVTGPDLYNEIIQSKRAVADELAKAKRAGWGFNVGTKESDSVSTITSGEISRATNVSSRFLESEEGASAFARQDAQAAYSEMRAQKGIKGGEDDISYIPSHAAVAYETSGLATQTSDTVSALTHIKEQQVIAQQAVDRAFAGTTGDLNERFFHPGDAAILGANRYGAGAGLVTFSNGSYGSLASWSEVIGKATQDLIQKLHKNTDAIMDSALLKLRTNQTAAIEFDKINNLVASTTEKYVLNEAGDGLVALKTQQYRDAIARGDKNVAVPVLQKGAAEQIPFLDQATGDAIAARIQTNGHRTSQSGQLRAAVGLEDSRNPNVYYPIKPNPKDFPYFAFVKDETVTGAAAGHTSMLHASSQADLDALIKMAREKTGFTVYTKADTEAFYKAQSDFEWDRTLHDNYIDSSLKSAGVNNQFFPRTNPEKIAESWLQAERRADGVLGREAVSTKFGNEFDQLQTLGEQYTNTASSRYGVSAKSIEGTVQNPYNDYRKTALNISRLSEYPLLSAFNKHLENGVSSVYQRIQDVWDEAKNVNDLERVNAALQSAGVSHAYKNAAEVVLANHSAPKPYLSQFIRGANSILANTFLRFDPLNALNNAIGAQVLLGHETTRLLKAINNSDGALAGDLAGINAVTASRITVPGTEDTIQSASTYIARAYKNYFSSDPTLKSMYKTNGWTTSLSDSFKSMLDDLSLQGAESVGTLNSKLSAALGKAKSFGTTIEAATGNKFAEELNRFVAADVARQISDVGVKAGVLTPESQLSYINTFVNRTQGNTLAAQRPLIFQGPIGQAIGLFQTFQFNTLQQLFRSVSEGSAKDAAVLLGLQGTLYGLNGLPAFQFINQHIVGTASGNKEHTDAYSALYGTAGKTAGDWLLYGIPSNLLQTNIYTRGDINPRTLTVVPTAPQDVVAVSAFAKFAGNLKETVTKMAGGGDVWQSFLQGVEHNSLSRPLAGLAQVTQAASGAGKVFSTTGAGDVSFVNDFMSLATLSRLAGGKPLDEALANDEIGRSMVYRAADRERMKAATEKFKTTVVGSPNTRLSDSSVHDYMDAFVKNGGRQEDFNKVMLQSLTRANTPRANQVIQTLKGPYSQHMRSLMGGGVQDLSTTQDEGN